MKVFPSLTASLAALVLVIAACAAPPPPPLGPEPEPDAEPEQEAIAEEPEAPPPIPLEERIRAPFAVQSEGRPAPRERRGDVVVLERAAARAPAAGTLDTATAPAEPSRAGNGSAAEPERPAPAREAAREPAARASTSVRQHVVRSGETFYAIARRYEVTPMALAAANPGIDVNRIRVGQTLRVPEPSPQPRAPAAGPTPAAPAEAPVARTHRVVAGETLWSIARRYGIPPDELRRANRMTDETVRVGQALVIPGQ